MKTILQLFAFFICATALYAEQVPLTITYFFRVGAYIDENFRYIMKEVPSDLYVLHHERTYVSNINSTEKFLKDNNTLFPHFTVPRSIYPGEEHVPPVFFDTTKLRLKWYKKDEDMNASFFPMDFYILNKNKVIIDSIRLLILRGSVPHEEGFYNMQLQKEIRKYIDPTQKILFKYEMQGPDRWNERFVDGIGISEWEREGDTLISAQSISHRLIRDSLGENFYDPFGPDWDNFNRDFVHIYDACVTSFGYPGCYLNCGVDRMSQRRHIAVHNAAAAPNVQRLSVIGNNGDKRRYGRGLWTGVEDTIPATDKEIEFYRALMCVCSTLPLKQELVFNDLTTVEDNISLIESKVFPNPSSRHFTVQGQAFTQLSVYDVLGTLIEKSFIDGTGQWKNNSALYPNGHYTIQLRHSDGTTENLSVIICH